MVFTTHLATPFTEMLLDSVAPDVNMTSLGSAPIRLAICARACSMAFSDSQP